MDIVSRRSKVYGNFEDQRVEKTARSRGTTVLAVGVLAFGLAAPTVLFSLLMGVNRPLPVPDGDRVVRVVIAQPARAGRPLAAVTPRNTTRLATTVRSPVAVRGLGRQHRGVPDTTPAMVD